MSNFIDDLLKTNGKWSFKRTTALYVLNIAIIYAFLPLVIQTFDIHEFVFWGFITYSGTMVGLVLKQKLAQPEYPTYEEEPLIYEEDNEQNY